MKESKGLMGLNPPKIGYDGIVRVGMQQIKVENGCMRLGNRRLSVTEEGQVTDERDKPVAQVKNGQLVPLQQKQQQPQAG